MKFSNNSYEYSFSNRKKNSTGIKGKNLRSILGRPSVEYAFIAAKHSIIDKIFVSSDCPEIKKISKKYEPTIIDRPTYLSMPESLTEDVLIHALKIIEKKVKKIKKGYFEGIGLDVLFQEPPKNNDGLIKLWRTKKHNILLSPHGSFYSEHSYNEMRSKAAKTIKDFFISKKLKNCVNLNYFK